MPQIRQNIIHSTSPIPLKVDSARKLMRRKPKNMYLRALVQTGKLPMDPVWPTLISSWKNSTLYLKQTIFPLVGGYCEFEGTKGNTEVSSDLEFKKSLTYKCSTDEPPGILKWTVPQDAPGLLYYQVIRRWTFIIVNYHPLCVKTIHFFSASHIATWDGKFTLLSPVSNWEHRAMVLWQAYCSPLYLWLMYFCRWFFSLLATKFHVH